MSSEGNLVLSSNWGRYAIGDPNDGPDLTSGTAIEVYIGGKFVKGRIEYTPVPIYATLGPKTLAEVAQMATRPRAIGGYYFVSDDGGVIGLCVDMKVRRP